MDELSRTSLPLVALLVGTVLLFSACGDDEGREVSNGGDARVAKPGQPLQSPSGKYELAVVEGNYGKDEGGGSFWRVQIRQGSEMVLDFDRRFSARFKTLALWDERSDRAWVYSSDIGTTYFELGDGGRWSGHSYGPERIARNDPAVPRELAEREPESFGPEGREKARRLVREDAEERSRQVVCKRTPDGGQICEPRGTRESKPIAPDDPRLNLPE